MVPSKPIPQTHYLSAPEQEISQQHFTFNADNETQAAELKEIIKEKLNIDRNVEQIKQYLDKFREEKEKKIYETPQVQKQVSLFKMFAEPKKQESQLLVSVPLPRKKQGFSFVSQRKVPKKETTYDRSNWDMQERLDQIQQINQMCTYTFDKFDRKLNKKNSLKEQNQVSPTILNFYQEFFYSNYDRKFFENDKMKSIYKLLNMKPAETTLKQHKKLLLALPKPKLLSQDLIIQYKNKLQQHRNLCRQTTKNLSKNNEPSTDFPVNSTVLALNPLCGHLHTGIIMAFYKQNLYMVRFLKPELPAQKILDINMSTQFTTHRMGRQFSFLKEKGINNETSISEIVEQINFQMSGYLIKILTFKNEIVKIMRNLNQIFNTKQNHSPQNCKNIQKSKQTFTWLVGIVQKLDKIIQQVIVKFRLRGVNEVNQNSVYGNLRSLLLNPLRLMSKEFQNSNEVMDVNAAQQIREIIGRQRNNQIKKALNSAIALGNTNENIEKSESDSKINNLLYSCLGILADLRFQGKMFDVENNPNLIKLAEIAGKDNSESFNEVYERLFSIVTKIKQ